MCSPAPEYLLDKTCDPISDIFSLGCLTYALFYDGKSPVACGQDLKVYKAKLEKLPTLDIEKLPATCRGFLIPSIKLRANIILMVLFSCLCHRALPEISGQIRGKSTQLAAVPAKSLL